MSETREAMTAKELAEQLVHLITAGGYSAVGIALIIEADRKRVREEERERCAEIADGVAMACLCKIGRREEHSLECECNEDTAKQIAAAIRGEQG